MCSTLISQPLSLKPFTYNFKLLYFQIIFVCYSTKIYFKNIIGAALRKYFRVV